MKIQKMRTFLLWTAFLLPWCAFSQVTDDFSDGDFTADPAWEGDAGRFVVDSKGQLRLSDEGKVGDARLSTPSRLSTGAEWTFYVHLYDNPSANFYALFYLTADRADLSGRGCCVQIGGADDAVSLLIYEGARMQEVIKGSASRLSSASPAVRVRVTCTQEGTWSLYTQVVGSDEAWVQEGEPTEQRVPASAYVGLRCVYTASRNKAVAFDDVVVRAWDGADGPGDSGGTEQPDEPEPPVEEGDPDDHTPPRLLTVWPSSASEVVLTFDEAVRTSRATFWMEGMGAPVSCRSEAEGRQLVLTFPSAFADMQSYELTVQGVEDRSGNRMAECRMQFTYYDPSLHTLESGDVVFNEVMANPVGAAGLPEVEYLELFNRTSRTVDLKGWTLYYGTRAIVIPGGTLPAGGYAVLCAASKVDQWTDSGVMPIGVPSFPTLANSGKLLWLTDARQHVVAWVDYTDAWYDDDFHRKGGFSLECVDVGNRSGDAANWRSSADKRGGTPGMANSVQGVCPDETRGTVDYAYLSAPDTAVVRFTKPMLAASVEDVDHYTVYRGSVGIRAAVAQIPDAREVHLALSDSLRLGEVWQVEWQQLTDVSGYPLEGDRMLTLGLPQEAAPGDVGFNELLFNPVSGGSDYVELYNLSEKFVDLHRLYLADVSADGRGEGRLLASLPVTLEPGGYLCLTADVPSLMSTFPEGVGAVWQVGRLPSMPDKAGTLLLLNAAAEVVDSVAYEAAMHAPFLSDPEGVSLEKIHPTLASAVPGHWTSASTSSGGGTPGLPNSQLREPAEKDGDDGFWLETSSFSPNGDGWDDQLLLRYRGLPVGTSVRIRIYDAAGRLVHQWASADLVAAEGVYAWDGRQADGSLARPGIYLIYIEQVAPSGSRKGQRMAAALTE